MQAFRLSVANKAHSTTYFGSQIWNCLRNQRVQRRAGSALKTDVQAVAALIGWRPQRVRLITNAGYDEIAGIANVAVANGRWFSNGLRAKRCRQCPCLSAISLG